METLRRRAREGSAPLYILLAVLCYLPLLLTARGRIASDTRQAIYLDPGRFLAHVLSIWDPSRDLGTVAHQNIVLVFPMATYYWVTHLLGIPMWVAQRLWLGSVLFAAAVGVLYLARTLRWRGIGPVVAAVVYAMSPYVLQYGTRTSVLLLPWAALPWLVALTERSLRSGGWRYPALFALVTLSISVNATSVALIMAGPILWILHSVWITKDVTAREAWRAALRIALLTAITSLWWVVALAIEGKYGLPLLRYTETIEQVASTASATEVLRGLGYWVPYLSQRGFAEISGAHIYLQDLPVLAAQFAVLLVAFLGAVAIRWRFRVFFIALIVIGVVVSVGAYPVADQSPLGSLFIHFARSSGVGLALRSTTRAAPLVLLGLACILGASVDALRARLPRTALVAGGIIALSAIVLAPSIAGGELVDPLYSRAENVPSYWPDALAYADAHAGKGRLLELPGTRYAAYNFGNTYEPITYGLANTPTAWREQIPYGGAGSADLLVAIDNRVQAGLLDPGALAPIARLMGVSELVVRNDLDSARYGTVTPEETQQLLEPLPAGLDPPVPFGPLVTSGATSVPSLEVVRVQDPPSLVQAFPVQGSVLLDGDADGLVDAAGAGVLDGRSPVLYAASTAGNPRLLRQVVRDGARIVLTDTNRRRVRRWRTVIDTNGITLRADQDPAAAVGGPGGEASLDVFGDSGSGWQTVLLQHGMRVSATAYGDPEQFQNGHAPAAALDGDLSTTWEVGPNIGGIGDALTVELDQPLRTDHLTISTTPYDRAVTAVDLRFDDGKPMRFTLDPALSRAPASQELSFPSRTFSKVSVTLADEASFGPGTTASPIGIAELGLDGRRLDEVVRLPTALVTRLGATSIRNPLSIVLTRKRGDPKNSRATQEESSIAREFTLPTARDFSLSGQARVQPDAAASEIAAGLDACRSDLLTIDGVPVPVRIDPPVAGTASVSAMSVVGCDGSLHLDAGRHELRTNPASTIAIDQLVLASDEGGTAAAVGSDGRPIAPQPPAELPAKARSNSSTSIDAIVHNLDQPAWLILHESLNEGWEATAQKSQDPAGPVLINGFANGWYVSDSRTATDTFALRWTPQRTMDIALLISAIGILAALVLAVRGRRWRAPATDPPLLQIDAPWSDRPPASLRRVLIAAAGCGIAGALVIDPVWGVVIAAGVALSGRWKHGHALLAGTTIGLFAVAFGAVVVDRSAHRDVPPDAFFAHTITAHRLAMAAITLLAADLILTVGRRLGTTADPFARVRTWRSNRAGRVAIGAPPPAPERADRRRFVRACWAGGIPGFVLFVWMLTGGTFDLFAYHFTANFYDAQAHAFLGGHLALPPGLLGIEAFIVDGKSYMYQGPTPALLRLPVALFTDSLDGRLAGVSMLLAFSVAAVAIGWLTWQIRGLTRGTAPVTRGETIAVAGFMFVCTGGSILLFSASQVSVYHESLLWGTALTIAALAVILRYLVAPSSTRLAVASVIVLLALWSRASVGLGGLAALAVAGAAEAIAWLRDRRNGGGETWIDSFRPRAISSGTRVLTIMLACAAPVVLYAGLNYAKFDTPFSVPWDRQEYTRLSESRQDFLAENHNSFFGLQFLPTTAVSYLRPDAFTLQRAFPWIGYRGDLLGRTDGYFNVRFDKIDATGSVPVSFPLLSVLGVVGLTGVVRARRRHRELAWLRGPLVGAAVGAATVFGFGFIAQRYLSDLFPFLVLAAAAGLAVVTPKLQRARAWRWRRVVIGSLVVLAVASCWVAFSQALWYQRVFASPPDEAATRAFVSFQQDVGSLYTDGAVTPVGHGPHLPTAGKAGELFIVGNCDGLYVSDGSRTDAVQPTNWKPVQRTSRVGAFDVDVRFPSAAPGVSDPLLSGGTTAQPEVVRVEYLGDGMARFAYQNATGELAGQPIQLTPGKRYRMHVSADPQDHQVSVAIDGRIVLLVPYTSSAPVKLGINDVTGSTRPTFSGSLRARNEANDLCREIRRKDFASSRAG